MSGHTTRPKMTNSYPDPKQLWGMNPHEFNEWRATNDLPILFNFLQDLLPSFNEWINELPFGMEVVLRIVPTGDIFKGDKKKVAIKRSGDLPGTTVIECREGTAEEAKKYWQHKDREIEILGEIEPYFRWAKRTLGRKRFFIWDTLNGQVADDFLYGSWSTNPNGVSQASLFRSFDVLKLGQVLLRQMVVIGSRNLDFCDLDGLHVTEDFHGSSWIFINYSSCQDIKFSNINQTMAFVKFHKCSMNKFTCQNSKLQDFYFEQTDVSELRLENSFIYKMGFKDSNITPLIQNTELREINFQPKKGTSPSAIAKTYRLFRGAYQRNGLRQEASECYYKERVFERKSYFHPDVSNNKIFQGIHRGGKISTVLSFHKKGIYQTAALPREIGKVLLAKIKMHTLPKYLIPLMKYRLKWLMSAFESILWGYGEKPSRILMVALTLISTYAGAYNFIEWIDDKGCPYRLNSWDSIYFSLVTFTTLGYGDITPKTQLLKLLAGSEALLGAFTMGLIVAGFSNKSRY